MAQCKQEILISTVYGCATFCEKWNTPPVPRINLVKSFLIQNAEFYDSGIIQDRKFKWQIFCKDHLIYETDWGGVGDFISDMNNGSTYGTLKLGVNNILITNFLNSLPHTIITKTDPITIMLSVKDCDGIINNIESNKYKFNKK